MLTAARVSSWVVSFLPSRNSRSTEGMRMRKTARMKSTTASTAGRTIRMTKLDHLCGSNFSIKRLLVSNVPPLHNDPVLIGSGKAVLQP